MSLSKLDTAPYPLALDTTSNQAYGLLSWLYFFLTSLISLSFLCAQLVVNAVRDKTISAASLDVVFYPDVYWHFVTANISLLAFSGALLGLTVAVIVVRVLLHYQCCKGYFVILSIQAIPWVYFTLSCN